MKKNVAGQVVVAQLVSKTDGSAVTTGTTSIYLAGDGGIQTLITTGSPEGQHLGNGVWAFYPSAGETNYDHVAFTFVNSSAVNATIQIYTSFPQTGDNYARLGAPVNASISADIAGVQADTDNIQTRLPTSLVSGRIDASVGAMASDVITAAAIATAAIDADAIAADAITDAKVASDVTIASVTGAVGSVTGAVGSVTGNVGGNVTGSVGSVVGAVGSVTGNVGGNVTGSVGSVVGAVGSVTGNVGGNVTGSVGSVATGGIAAASFAAGAINAAAIATDAIDADALAADAVTEIQSGLSTLNAAGVRSAVGLASANLDTQLSAIDDYVDTEVSAIKAVTDKLNTTLESTGSPTDYVFTSRALAQAPTGGTDPWLTSLPGAYGAGTAGKIVGDNLDAAVSSRAVAGDAMALTGGERTTLAGVIWATTVEGTRTAIQMMRGFASTLLSKASGMGTTTAVFRDIDDTKARVTATVDADGNRSAVTLDLT